MTALFLRMIAILALFATPLGMSAPASATTAPVSASADHCGDQEAPAQDPAEPDCCDDCPATCVAAGTAIAPLASDVVSDLFAAGAMPRWMTANPNHEADRPPFEPPPPRTA